MDFVVGHPRSGTQLMSELLDACAGAKVSQHELLAALTVESVAGPSEYYEGRRDAQSVARLIEHYERRPERAIRIDCNWKLTWILPPLLAAYPDARVLHLVRDPRDNVRSTHDLDYYGALCHHPAYQTDEKRNRWLRSLPAIRRPDWERLSPFARNCAFWTESHRLILETAAPRGRYLRARLEDLGDEAVRDAILRFFELAPSAAWAEGLRTRHNTKENEKQEVRALRPDGEWPADAQDTLLRLCGEMAGRLGYRVEP